MILVAEDDDVVRHLIHRVLTMAGYSVLLASDGMEAVDVFEQNGGVIDLLLSDITMPRLGGIPLLHRLRAARPGLKALMISGRTSSEIRRGDSSFEFLAKPFRPAQLRDRVELILAPEKDCSSVDPDGPA